MVLNIMEDRATTYDKEGIDWCLAVLLRVSQLEGQSSDTDDQPSSHETRSNTAKHQSIPSLTYVMYINIHPSHVL